MNPVLTLYEVTTGFVGTSYIRCYAVASSVKEAYKEVLKANHLREKNLAMDDLKFTVLMTLDSGPFATKLNDEGWEV